MLEYSFVEPPLKPQDPAHREGVSSFFDWHAASRKQVKGPEGEGVAGQARPSSAVHRLVQQMSLEAESSSSDDGGELRSQA